MASLSETIKQSVSNISGHFSIVWGVTENMDVVIQDFNGLHFISFNIPIIGWLRTKLFH